MSQVKCAYNAACGTREVTFNVVSNVLNNYGSKLVIRRIILKNTHFKLKHVSA